MMTPTKANGLKFRTDANFKAWLAKFDPDRLPQKRQHPPEPANLGVDRGIAWAAATTLTFSPGDAARCHPGGNLETRLEQLTNVFVDNDQAVRALAKLERTWAASRLGRYSVLFLTGHTRTGKTRILAQFASLHPPVRERTEHGARTRWPVFFLPGVPSPCTARGLCGSIFH